MSASTVHRASSRRVSPWLFLAVLVVLLLVTGGYFAWSSRRVSAAAPATSASDADSGLNILLELASRALAQQHLLAPQGANAFEFYLSARELDPHNATVAAAFQQWMPTALQAVEQTINERQLDEAQRELRLLQDVDANNYTVSLLTAKLDAQRVLVVRQDEARAARMQAAQASSEGQR